MKNLTRALLGFAAGLAVLAAITLTTGCHAQKPVRVPRAPYKAHFDAAHCRYLPDGIMFRCKDVVFDPEQLDAGRN